MAQASAGDGARAADRLKDACRLDQAKMQGTSAALYLINFLDNLEIQLALADAPSVEQAIQDLETCLSTLVTAANTPLSAIIGRPVRRTIARIYTIIYERRDGRGLFDSVRLWLELAGDAKASLASRLLAFHLISENLQSHGKRVTSILPDVWQTSSKIMRLQGAPVIMRAAACCCGQFALSAQAPIANEALAREALKQLKQLLSEKSFFLQRCAADALSSLFTSSPPLHALPDIDAAIALCIKALDCAPWTTRISIVGVVVTLSILTQIERSDSSHASLRKQEEFIEVELQRTSMPARTSTTLGSRLSSAEDMLTRLSSHYHRSTSASTRNAIIQIYSTLIHRLGYTFVEENHQLLLRHFFIDLRAGLRSQTGRYQSLLLRRYVHLIAGELIASRLTRGDMCILRIRQVTSDYLEPALRTAFEPEALTSALQYISCLLLQLGTTGQDDFSQNLFATLSSLTSSAFASVRAYAIQACTILLTKSPSSTSLYVSQVQDSLTDDMQALEAMTEGGGEKEEMLQRLQGRALLLASLVATATSCPLYVPMDVMNRLMSLAIRVLRGSSGHPLSQALVETQAAWHIIDGLVNLGHEFTGIHLPQLLLLWKNAVPKISVKDVAVAESRTAIEWQFLLGIRQSALRSLASFLSSRHALELLSADVTRRILNILHYGFISLSQASTAILENSSQDGLSATTVHALLLYQLRLLAFASALLKQEIPLPPEMALDIALLCSSLISGRHTVAAYLHSTSLSQVPAKATTLWEIAEHAPSTLNSLLNKGMEVDVASPSLDSKAQEDTLEYRLEAMLRKPALPALEHDIQACITPNPARRDTDAVPSPTLLVDSAICLLSQLFPTMSEQHQVQLMSKFGSSIPPEINTSWHYEAEYRANVLAACQAIVTRLAGNRKRKMPIAEGVLHELSKHFTHELAHRNVLMRDAAAAGIGQLCELADANFMSNCVQASVAYIVSDTSPDGRAGRASAFAEVYCSVGTLAAAPALKVIVEVLLSLVTDPHPTVRYWAVRALAKIVQSAGLDYSPYINATTAVIIKLYMDISSEPAGAPANISSIHATYSTYEVIAELLTALIGLLGPGSGASSTIIAACTAILRQFLSESDTTTIIAANKALQSLLIVLPHTIPLPILVKVMQDQLSFAETATKASAITSIYQLVQRDVSAMSNLGGSTFVEGLFRLLDDEPQIYGIQSTIYSWLDQTGAQNPQAWIDISRRVMQRGVKRKADWADAAKGESLEDEESVGLGSKSIDPQRTEVTRWTTQVFALQCLSRLLDFIWDARLTGALTISSRHPADTHVLSRLPDLMRITFISTSSDTLEVQLAGLQLLRLIIRRFSAFRDPSSPQIPLLEQFQAPIVSVLASMLLLDQHYESLSLALLVSGEYISSQAIRDTTGIKRLTQPLTERLRTWQATRSPTNTLQGQAITRRAAEVVQGSMLYAWALIAHAAFESDSSRLLELLQERWQDLQEAWITLLRARALKQSQGQKDLDHDDTDTDRHADADLPWLPILKAFLLPHAELSRQSPTFSTESDVSILLGTVIGQLCDLINSWNGSATQTQSACEALQCLHWLAQATTTQYGTDFFEAETKKEVIRLCWRLYFLQAPVIDAHLPGIVFGWQKSLDRSAAVSFTTDAIDSTIRLLLRLMNRTPAAAAEAWKILLKFASTLSDNDRFALVSITWFTFLNMSGKTVPAATEADLLRVFSRSITEGSGDRRAGQNAAGLRGVSASLVRRISSADGRFTPVASSELRALRILFLTVTSCSAINVSSMPLLDDMVSSFSVLASRSRDDEHAAQVSQTELLTAWKALLGMAAGKAGCTRWFTLRSLESLTALLCGGTLGSSAESYFYECLSVLPPILGDVGITYLLSVDLFLLLSDYGSERPGLRNRSARNFRIFASRYQDDRRRQGAGLRQQDALSAKVKTAVHLFNKTTAVQDDRSRRQTPAISLRAFS